MKRMTSEDIRRTLGPLDEKTIGLILATGATAPELVEAFHALDHEDDRGDALAPPLSPRVHRVRALLDALWGDDDDDDEDGEDEHADWFQSVAR
jgi:hypothetical protein